MDYTEDDLREAFYKGREQACLPDEKGTIMFLRPTFNGYLRELDGKEDPHANFKQRVDSLINDKDYDLNQWEDMKKLQELQKKFNSSMESKDTKPGITLHNNTISQLKKWIQHFSDEYAMEQVLDKHIPVEEIKGTEEGEDMTLAIKLLRRLIK